MPRFSRGYAEAEIEAVFAKYDVDGDRVLDEKEQRRMQADLEGQKVCDVSVRGKHVINLPCFRLYYFL